MPKVERIHKGKQPNRPHHIQDWAELRGFKKQSELAKELGADKSLVSRWYDGTSPAQDWQRKLAALFFDNPEETESLFRHPDDDWIARFLRGRSREEVERAKRMLEAAFPPATRKAS